MTIIIKYKMSSPVNTTVRGVPRLLTTNFDAHHKDVAEKAVAHYMRDEGMTPKKFAASEFMIK